MKTPCRGLAARLAALLVVACSFGPGVVAADATPSDAAVRDAMDYYQSWLTYRQQYLRVPGVQVAVRVGNREVLAESFGLADLEQRTPLRNDHLLRVASHSKTFTATAAMQLVEEGKLRLDDTAGQWLPWLAESDSSLADVTVRELLTHSAGVIRDGQVSDFWQLDILFPDADGLRKELLAPTAPVVPANERYKYSNVGYGLLGSILEAASGQSYASLMQQRIIGRLGLRNIGPDIDPTDTQRFATGYTSYAHGPQRIPIEHIQTGALAAATGFYSNAQDLASFFSAHFMGDTRLLSDASKRRMQHPHWDSGRSKYGLGMSIDQVGDRTLVGHSGGFPGFISLSLVDPQDKIAVSVITTAIDGPAGALARGAFHLLDLAAKPRPEGAPADAQLKRFTGRYATLFTLTDIALLGGRLYMISPSAADPATSATPLEYVDANTLRVRGKSSNFGESMVFTFAADGSVESMRMGGRFVPLDRYPQPDKVRLKR